MGLFLEAASSASTLLRIRLTVLAEIPASVKPLEMPRTFLVGVPVTKHRRTATSKDLRLRWYQWKNLVLKGRFLALGTRIPAM
jgi:hypothetical protein